MYTLARLVLLVACFVVVGGLWVVVAGTTAIPWLWPLLIAAAVSAVASYYLLRGPRERFAARVDARATTISRRFEEARAKEDED